MNEQKLMTVGELAKKVNTTVRTIQYYDREGLLKPSQISEGGRRLYSGKDMLRLHQILSLKYLGFSLDDIKTRLTNLDTPNDVAAILSQQADIIQQRIAGLNEALLAIQSLQSEVLQMQKVDFIKYAQIIELLQQKNQNYWVVKHFDEKVMDHINGRFTKEEADSITNKLNELCDQAVKLCESNISPESELGLSFAKEWWDMVMEFTKGDMSLIPELQKFSSNRDSWDNDLKLKFEVADTFISKSLEAYLASQPLGN